MNTIKTISVPQSQVFKRISELRLEIDAHDSAIIHLLSQRFSCVKTIKEIKHDANLTVCDPIRESSQFAHFVSLARLNKIPPEQIIAPFRTIINLSKQAQYDTQMVNTEPIVPKFCLPCGWRTCGIEVPESDVRVCPACRSPLF